MSIASEGKCLRVPPPNSPARRTLRSNFVWAFAGNAISQFCMWLVLVLLAKWASVETVGVFAIGQAVALPVSMLLSFKLQLVQVTDARDEYTFGHYYALRLLLALATILVVSLIAFAGYEGPTVWVMAVLGLGYGIVNLREVFLAVLQKYERMDLMSHSRVLFGVSSLLCFAGVFYTTRSLAWSVAAMAGARLAVMIFVDRRLAHRLLLQHNKVNGQQGAPPVWHWPALGRLLKLAAPMGLVAWLGALFTSIPRLVLERTWGEAAVGYFAALSALLVVGSMVVAALGQTASPRLAVYYQTNRRAFVTLLAKLCGLTSVLGILAIGVSLVAGRPILALIFRPDYAEHARLFVYLMIAGAFWHLFSCLVFGLTAMRCFRAQSGLFLFAAAACAAASWALVPSYGMYGAAWALMACMIAGCVGSLALLVWGLRLRVSDQSVVST